MVLLRILVIWMYRTTKEADMTTAVADRTLNAADRCDRCGAQAYVRVVLESSGGELLFCGHHARAVEATLRPLTSDWHDETERLNEKAPVPVD
jgi:hypothetical protein